MKTLTQTPLGSLDLPDDLLAEEGGSAGETSFEPLEESRASEVSGDFISLQTRKYLNYSRAIH